MPSGMRIFDVIGWMRLQKARRTVAVLTFFKKAFTMIKLSPSWNVSSIPHTLHRLRQRLPCYP
jgi:hypothetical protein